MIISSSNIIKEAALTISPESATQEISVVTDGDYSSVYTDSLDVSSTISIVFGSARRIGYLAIGGSNISKKDRIVVNITDNSDRVQLLDSNLDTLKDINGLFLVAQAESVIDDDILGLPESNVIMYRVDIDAVQSIEIIVFGSGTLAIAEIAVGEYYEVPNSGEQAGYNRAWTVPNTIGRSGTNLQSSPIALTYESRSLKGRLTVPNNLMTDFDSWYAMSFFAASNTFYILEDDDKFHSYACFNADFGMTKAHGQTRSLGVSTLSFNAYAKSTEAILI